MSALIVVDVQNDFISGSLAISNCPAQHNGEEVSKFNSQNIWMYNDNEWPAIAVLQSKLRNSGRIEGGDFNLNIMVTYVAEFQ